MIARRTILRYAEVPGFHVRSNRFERIVRLGTRYCSSALLEQSQHDLPPWKGSRYEARVFAYTDDDTNRRSVVGVCSF